MRIEDDGEDDVVLAVDSRAANEWPQVVRGQCGRSALSTTSALRKDEAALAESVAAVAARVEEGGGRLLLLAAVAGAVWLAFVKPPSDRRIADPVEVR